MLVLTVPPDVIFEDRPIQRFWFLETVARMPYFSYLSMLHFLETLGWWTGGAEVRRVHFAEVRCRSVFEYCPQHIFTYEGEDVIAAGLRDNILSYPASGMDQ